MYTTRSLLPPPNSLAATQLHGNRRPPHEEAMISLSMGSAPRGLQLAWGFREEWAKERQDPLLSERTFVASKTKEATF